MSKVQKRKDFDPFDFGTGMDLSIPKNSRPISAKEMRQVEELLASPSRHRNLLMDASHIFDESEEAFQDGMTRLTRPYSNKSAYPFEQTLDTTYGGLEVLGGLLGGVTAPLMAPVRSYASRPLENSVGIPKELTEIAAGFVPFGGLIKGNKLLDGEILEAERIKNPLMLDRPTIDIDAGGSNADAYTKNNLFDNVVNPNQIEKPGSFVMGHSSPHDFYQPDLSKIGTGEGAQMYGHGFYGSDDLERKNVLKFYDDKFTQVTKPDMYSINGNVFTKRDINTNPYMSMYYSNGASLEDVDATFLNESEYYAEKANEFRDQLASLSDDANLEKIAERYMPSALRTIRSVNKKPEKLQKIKDDIIQELGFMKHNAEFNFNRITTDYNTFKNNIGELVTISGGLEPANKYNFKVNTSKRDLLDLDAPIDEQNVLSMLRAQYPDLYEKYMQATRGEQTGMQFYDTFGNILVNKHPHSDDFPDDKATSEFLSKMGIKGNIYDAGHHRGRDVKNKIRNYVIFDDEIMEPLTKFK